MKSNLDEDGTIRIPDAGKGGNIIPEDTDAVGKLTDAIAAGVFSPAPEKKLSGAEDYKAQKELASMRRKRESALKKCEDMIDALEARNREINSEMSLADVATNAQKLKWLAKEQEEINERLLELYDEWETLS